MPKKKSISKVKKKTPKKAKAKKKKKPIGKKVLKSLAKVRGSAGGFFFAESFMIQKMFQD